MKRNKKPKFSLNIHEIKKERHERVEKKANDIKNENLTHDQKIMFVLKGEKDTTVVKNNIKEDLEKRVNNISKTIKENDLDNPEKKELKKNQEIDCNINTSPNLENLKLCNSGDANKENTNDSKIINNNTENKNINQEKNNETSYLDCTNNTTINVSNINNSSLNLSNLDNSKISFYNNNNSNILIMPVKNENIIKEFNDIRSKFYEKHKFNDIPLNQCINIITPEKYKINEKIYAYLYPNDLNTYNITESCYLKKDSEDISNDNKEEEIEIDEKYGLFFCGKEIMLEDEVHTKKCMPNEFMCKECMEKNKNKYNIKNKYLININGRIAKINKGSYHCFGHFSNSNQIEDCITTFSCNACKMLDSLSKYYN